MALNAIPGFLCVLIEPASGRMTVTTGPIWVSVTLTPESICLGIDTLSEAAARAAELWVTRGPGDRCCGCMGRPAGIPGYADRGGGKWAREMIGWCLIKSVSPNLGPWSG